jgi:hypothetical protein
MHGSKIFNIIIRYSNNLRLDKNDDINTFSPIKTFSRNTEQNEYKKYEIER